MTTPAPGSSSGRLQASFSVASPNRADAELVMIWRNDPVTLAMSFHSDIKQMPSYLDEFISRYFVFEQLPPQFILADGRRCGFIGFTSGHPLYKRPATAWIDIHIAPERRGQGLGLQALEFSKALARSAGFGSLGADVKVENQASAALFERAGFDRLGLEDHAVPDLRQTFKILRYGLLLA